MLLLGTMFAPVEDRDQPGMGFTHKSGDVVRISADELGGLVNRVMPSEECEPWTFGARRTDAEPGAARPIVTVQRLDSVLGINDLGDAIVHELSHYEACVGALDAVDVQDAAGYSVQIVCVPRHYMNQ